MFHAQIIIQLLEVCQENYDQMKSHNKKWTFFALLCQYQFYYHHLYLAVLKNSYDFQNFTNYHHELVCHFCHCGTDLIDRPISVRSFRSKNDETAHCVNESAKLGSFGILFLTHILTELFCDVCHKFYSILLWGLHEKT